jgi:glycosyltransferase involved in cell wall biosynthesis
MVDSIHTARWLAQFRSFNLRVIIFPSTPHRRIHPDLLEIIREKNNLKVSIVPLMRQLSLPLTLLDAAFHLKLRAWYLRNVIRTQQPQIIHGLETQHAGYLITEVVSKLKTVPKVYLSIWGSDLVWFKLFARHRQKIGEVLSCTDYLGVECRRDIELARSMGFKGKVLPIVPASGGINTSIIDAQLNFQAPSERKKILVKGYSGFVGQSITALKALSELASELRDYQVNVYSASFKTRRFAKKLLRQGYLNIRCYPKHSLSHKEVLRLFSEARVSISISLSDGFPGSLREAMMTGCFPIESKNSCGCEWANSGKSAFFVDPQDMYGIVSAVRRALTDNSLVDNAANLNRSLAEDRFSTSVVSSLIENYYLVT